MKRFLSILFCLLSLVACTSEQPTTASTAVVQIASTTTPISATAVPMNTSIDVTNTATLLPTSTVTNTLTPTISTITIPKETPVSMPTQPLSPPTGFLLFFWDTETPLEEPLGYSIPVSSPKQDLYLAIPGSTPTDWSFTSLLSESLDLYIESPSWPVVALSPTQTKIAFTSGKDIDGDGEPDRKSDSIYVYDIANASLSAIVNDTGIEIFGLSWLPDDQTLSYVQDRDVFQIGLNHLVSEKLAGTFSTDLSQLLWSPNGELLAIQLNPSPYSLAFYKKSTGEIISVTTDEPVSPTHMVWSPNSQWFVFNKGGNAGLVLVNAATLEVTALVNFGFSDPSWASDGAKLAYTQVADTNSSVFIWDAETLTTTELIREKSGGLPAPVWSPDNKELAVSFTQDSIATLFVIEVETAKSRQLLQMEDIINFQPLSWSPDGQWLLFMAAHEDDSGLYLIHKDGGESHLLLDTTGTVNPYKLFWLPGTPIVP